MSVSLVLGDFDLISTAGDYETSVLAEGTSRGNPVPIEVAVKSWLKDGAIVVTQGYDNREVRVRVCFKGTDLQKVALAEAALFAELGKPNTLTWTPPDGSPASVFKVVTSSLDPEDDDLAEIQPDPYRTYGVQLVCKAFVHSVGKVVVPALPGGTAGTTNVDNGSSAVGWTGSVNGVTTSPSVSSGAVGITAASAPSNTRIVLTRTGSITTSSTKYLVVTRVYDQGVLTATGDGVILPPLASIRTASGERQDTFYVAASSVSSLRLEWWSQTNGSGGSVTQRFYVDAVDRTDVRPSFGTTRQQTRSADMIGSAPAPGTLTVEHASNALGTVLVYTWAAGVADAYIPALTPYLTGSPTTATGNVSNGYVLDARSHDVPQSVLVPGSYLVMTRVAADSGTFTGTLGYDTRTLIGAGTIDSHWLSPDVPVSLTTSYQIVTLGKINLPVTDVADATSAILRFGVFKTGSGSVRIDEVWLFNTTIGQIVQVDCGTGSPAAGGPSKRLFINAPTLDRGPTVLRGDAADQSDAFYAGVQAWQIPEFKPPKVNVFTVTTGTLDADVSFQFYPHWHTHAAS